MTGPVIRVLVVDDDQGARALHCRFVDAVPGFTVAGAAGTGRDALAQSAAGVDLVLLDMRLPDISGVEVLHRLRTVVEVEPDVLVISSSHDQTTVRQALAARVVGYLVKPFTEAALRERLERYREERQARSDAGRDRPLAQGEIDRLLATGGIRTITAPSGGSRPLPKGLAAPTLARVLEALDPVAGRSVLEVASACDLSRATAHRYLTHLADSGAIAVSHRYGRRGRPEVLYRIAPV
ncbi:response regulator [Microbacterium sp. KSW4-11]|uniref:Response regulator n=1 Tax=Microbacterium gawkjiense TaxID=3067309 RepID=A0ABU3G6G0_9MICO|nr:response regulator [Microbacterium sp. KSW4-11]MDT3315379.1 response regulator [Microbacterium sp. KSW4-11]